MEELIIRLNIKLNSLRLLIPSPGSISDCGMGYHAGRIDMLEEIINLITEQYTTE